MPRYRRRRARTASLSRFVRARAVGVMFLVFASLIIAAIGYLTSLVPSTYIVISSSGISVTSTLPQNSTGFDLKIIAALLGGFGGIYLVISGLRRLGVRL